MPGQKGLQGSDPVVTDAVDSPQAKDLVAIEWLLTASAQQVCFPPFAPHRLVA